MSGTLPTLNGVSDATLNLFLNLAAGNVTIDDKRPLPEILKHKGRCIQIYAKGPQLNWPDCAEVFMGAGLPVEEFRLEGNKITARLKTAAQIEADERAIDLDVMYGHLPTFHLWAADEPAARTKTDIKRAETREKKKQEIPEGAAQVVLRVMKQLCPAGQIDTEELIAETKSKMPKDVDARGDDRRRKYIKQAIAKLVEREFLFIHGADQEQISLSNVAQSGEAFANDHQQPT